MHTQSGLKYMYLLPAPTVQHTLDSLHQMFAAYILPSKMVSDNEPQFVQEFACFMELDM